MLKVTGERVEALTLVPFFAVYKGSLEMCMVLKLCFPVCVSGDGKASWYGCTPYLLHSDKENVRSEPEYFH